MKAERIVAGLALGVLLLSAGCKKSQPAPQAAPVQYTAINYATGGSIEGTIHFAGKAPRSVKIDMSQDPACISGTPSYTEGYVVNNGGMANVFIYVKSGLGGSKYAPPAQPVVMKQKNCRFVPHVIGVMAGQPVEWVNDDSTMHNVHVVPTVPGNHLVDFSQLPSQGRNERTFAQPELMMPVRCDIHPWMQALINVAPNPFFAVSNAQGQYTIRGLPPGTYTLVADQENLGTRTAVVTVGPKQTVTQDFTYTMNTRSAQ